MQFDTPLTIEGRERLRKAVVEYESLGYERRRDALREELGAERFSKGHVYLLPCIHEGRRHAESRGKENYILKVCGACADGNTAHWEDTRTAYCFLDLELGVWETAVRRGDDDLLCPIHDTEQREGWMLMEYADPATDENLYNDPKAREARTSGDLSELCGARLRDRGWLPESYQDMDIEAMAVDGRLIALDYEAIYHTDWMYDPLDWYRSPDLRRDSPHTATSLLEIDEHSALEDGRPRVGSWLWKVVENKHYSKIMSRAAIKAEAAELKRKERGEPPRHIQRERRRIKHRR